MYKYWAEVIRVVDGDTVDMLIDLGFDVWVKQRIRLLGIDTAEKKHPLGKATKKAMADQLEGKIILIEVTKPDKYGRYLGTLWLTEASTSSINDQLYVNRLAKLYDGGSKTSLWTAEELSVAAVGVVFE